MGSKECIEVCKQVHVGKKLESNQTYVERNSRNFPWHSLSSRGCECLLQPTARLRTPAVAASSRDRDFSHSRPTRTATCGPTVRLHCSTNARCFFEKNFRGLALGSIGANVCKKMFALGSIAQDLQDLYTCAPLHAQHVGKTNLLSKKQLRVICYSEVTKC